MFCVLSVEKKKLTLLEKIFRFLACDEYSINTIPVFKGAPFYKLNAKVCDDIDWEKVIECAGKCSKRLLVSENLKIPQRKEIGTFNSNILYGKAFRNTLVYILENNKCNKELRHIAIVDKNGKYTEFTSTLTRYASKLTVVTENKEKYMSVCDEILEKTGLCISLLSEYDNAEIKIDADRNIMSIDLKTEFINISNAENLMADELYEKLIPDGVMAYDFYSALYELCGVFSLGECIFENVSVNNEKKRTDSVTFS